MTPPLDAVPRALLQLAKFNGIQTSYRDSQGKTRGASRTALVAALHAIYPEITGSSDFEQERRRQETQHWHRRVDPVAVAWDGRLAGVELRAPAAASGAIEVLLQLETGEERGFKYELQELPCIRQHSIGDEVYVARLITTGRLPAGYHRLRVSGPGLAQDVLIISAPRRAYERPDDGQHWGAFLPLYALHTTASWGAGDYSDLASFGEWVSSEGGRMVATLPLLPTYLSDPYEPSPYMPVSRLFWNEFYVDPRAATAFPECPEAKELVGSPDFQREVNELRALPFVDYRRQLALKRRVLSLLSESALRSPDVAAELAAFVKEMPDVQEYASFRAAHELQAKPWREWSDRSPDISDGESYRFYLYSQFLAEQQIEAMAARSRSRGDDIYLDLPLGCHSDGYDTWRYPESFVEGISCGAPPDVMFTSGQDWGFQPLDPAAARETGYEVFRRVIAHHLRFANVLRIDHVMSLHRLYWVPHGLPAQDGVYVRYRAEELYAILSLESHRNQATVVGENLGTVPGYVNRTMERHGIYKTYVLQYELAGNAGGLYSRPQRRSFASLNTHDMPPFAGFLEGSDIAQRVERGITSPEAAESEKEERLQQRSSLVRVLAEEGLIAPGAEPGPAELFKAATAFLAASEARYLLINLEDFWQETESHNTPGTPTGNWVQRARFSPDRQDVLPP